MKISFSVLLNIVLAVALLGAAYVFVVRGKTAPGDDGRTTVLLSSAERDMVLGEMRGMLEAVRDITGAIAENDMFGVIETAKSVGMGATGNEPVSLVAKLPLEFKTLGMQTHGAFDELATLASVSEDPLEVAGALNEIMYNCTSCHAGYRFGSDQELK